MDESFIPKYYRIKEEIRRRIASGEYGASQRIPSESELAQEFSVSRGTVERAIRLLVKEGILYREQGKGTFVASPRFDEISFRLSDFWEEAKRAGHKTKVRLLKAVKRPADELTASRLEIAPGAPIIEIERLSYVDEVPIAYEFRRLAYELCPALLEEDLENSSIHLLLTEKYRIPLLKAVYTIEAIVLKDEMASLLEVAPGTPGFMIDRLTYTKGLRPAVWFHQIYRGDRYRFTAELAPLT
ncbi:MAG: GntR family transcriptional regulator [Anaerolineae bacterium]|nr:GntR family transcriptional regulator [Anaerolineae bacterium]MDW8101930.1 GntR family transcriptional regulator [Anaerolineae bacterium]